MFHWIMTYATQFAQKLRPYLFPTNNSWRVNSVYFLLKALRDKQVGKRFHNNIPRSITTDNNEYQYLPQSLVVRLVKYLNNIVKQDHRQNINL